MTRLNQLFFPAVCLITVGCGFGNNDAESTTSVALTDVFSDTTIIILGENPRDLIGSIGKFIELRDGSLVLSDGMVPRIHRFDASGRLLDSFGVYGEGPGEFRSIRGVTQNDAGKLLVVDSRLGRVTILGAGLTFDTIVRILPLPQGSARAWGEGILFQTSFRPRQSAIMLVNDRQAIWHVPSPSPGSIVEYPYWNGYGKTLITTSPKILFTAFSLQYPIYLYNRYGTLVDSLSRAPATFRSAPVVSRGAFAGPNAQERVDAWMAKFDIIADLNVVEDTLLVVSHGTLRRIGSDILTDEHHVDIYHIPSRMKIFEDLALPKNGDVLGGGDFLYVLIKRPPDPWTVMRVMM